MGGATALEGAETAAALDRYRRRATVWAAGTGGLMTVIVLLAVTGWVGDVVSDGWIVLPAMLLAIGLGSLLLSLRMRRALASRPWGAYAAVAVPRTLHSATVVLRDPATGEMWPLQVVAVRQRYHLAVPGPAGVLWWCGDPRTGGVLAPPGGTDLIWTKPVRGDRARMQLARMADAQGFRGGVIPQPQPEQTVPVAVPPSRSRRWLRGRWRWVVLVSAVVLGLGIYGSEAADRDPQIHLTVLSEEPDGSCVVRWTDPWDKRQHTGPYRCDPERDPILHDWETGWLVSYGPWKGDLYNWEWWGTPANDVNDSLFIVGALGVLSGLVGGGVRRVRGKSTDPVPGAASHVSLVKDPAGTDPEPSATYADFAAAAEQQAVFQISSRRPEADVRVVPWWRVRSLRDVAGLPRIGMGLATCAFAGVMWATGWEGPSNRVIAAVALGSALVLYAGYKFLTVGRPCALLLARAATAPVPVPKRYTLLHDPYGGGPVLLLFPAHGDEDEDEGEGEGEGEGDVPEGMVVLHPPGTEKRPWLGLPSEPTGVADLRGWLDHSPDGDPFVVPWIEGRALWPDAPYEALDLEDPDVREYLARLAPAETSA